MFRWLRFLHKQLPKPYDPEEHLHEATFKGELARFLVYAPPGSMLHIGTIYRDEDSVRKK